VSDEAGGDAERGPKSPLRRTLDLCVFAPVGLAVTVVEDLPDLVAKGRRRVELELGNARVVGRFVVNRGQRRVSGHLDDLLRGSGDGDAHGADDPTSEPTGGPAPGSPVAEPVRPPRDSAAAAIVSGALADYDTLSASQVVPRLESLGPDELEAVLRYEASHRNRRTIMRRASQLLDEGTDGTGPDGTPAPWPGTAE
jgi:hypothetical protein